MFGLISAVMHLSYIGRRIIVLINWLKEYSSWWRNAGVQSVVR